MVNLCNHPPVTIGNNVEFAKVTADEGGMLTCEPAQVDQVKAGSANLHQTDHCVLGSIKGNSVIGCRLSFKRGLVGWVLRRDLAGCKSFY